jgi:hypothetical protein
MEPITISEKIDQQRRRLFGAPAMTIAAAQFGVAPSAHSQPAETKLPAIKSGTHTSFGPLKQIDDASATPSCIVANNSASFRA